MIGRGVAYRKTEETDLCWSATVETGVLFIRRGVAYRKTRLHGISFISTIDLLQPPWATVHPPSTSSSLHGLLFIQPPPRATPSATVQPPLHRLLFIQPSTPRGPVQPPLHGHPSTVYCSSSPPPHHGVLFIQRQRHRSLFIQTPRNAHCSSQRQHRSASVSSSSEGIARLGSVNSHRSIARVQ